MNDIRGTIMNITKNVTKSSGDIFKTTKLSVNLANEQELLKGLYMDIGKKVHEIYQYGGTLGKFFDEKYQELEAAEKKIDDLKEQIAAIRGVQACPKCGKNVEKSAEFCPKCGIRMDTVSYPSDGRASVHGVKPMDITDATGGLDATANRSGSVPSAPPPAPTETSSHPILDTASTTAPAPPIPADGIPLEPAFSTPGASFESATPLPEMPFEASPANPGLSLPPPKAPSPAPPTITPDSATAAPAKRICNACGGANDADTKFCLFCGRVL